MNILITGGAGFIGSHLVRHMVNKYPDYNIINFDVLTYAGNLENIQDVENAPNYDFVKGDIMELQICSMLQKRTGMVITMENYFTTSLQMKFTVH